MKELSITALGTVSPYSKGNMNLPGYLVKYKDKLILLDCGSGITRLMNFPNDLNNLTVIITHYHKDHYSDLSSIEYASHVYCNLGLLKQKVDIYIPNKEYCNRKKEILNNKETYANYHFIKNNSIINIDDLKISFHDNHSHTIETFMIKLETKNKKVVYTSDIGNTNFSDAVSFSKDSDLLICESTFLKKHNSNSKTHLRGYEAGQLAKLSNSKKLILTHFWPEENKNEYLKEAKENFKNTYILIEGEQIII